MGKQDFDNLMKILKVENVFTSSTVISQEVDFELPRGFIAKIWGIFMQVIEINEDLEGVISGVAEITSIYTMGLHRDPDETALIQIPRASVQHDGIMDHFVDIAVNGDVDGTSLFVGDVGKWLDIPKHIDLITARNMRFNSTAGGADFASLTEAFAQCTIYYTLEKVTDADILELLDIL